MAKSERLLTQKDVIQKTTVPKSTRSAPSFNIHPSAPPQSSVGLRLWPNRNMELVVAGKHPCGRTDVRTQLKASSTSIPVYLCAQKRLFAMFLSLIWSPKESIQSADH